MGIILRYVCWGTHRPPPPPGSLAADRPTRRPPRFGSTKGGGRGPPPLQPPKLSHTPRGHTLAGGPRGGGLRLYRMVPTANQHYGTPPPPCFTAMCWTILHFGPVNALIFSSWTSR